MTTNFWKKQSITALTFITDGGYGVDLILLWEFQVLCDLGPDTLGTIVAEWPEGVGFPALDTLDGVPFQLVGAGLVGGDELVDDRLQKKMDNFVNKLTLQMELTSGGNYFLNDSWFISVIHFNHAHLWTLHLHFQIRFGRQQEEVTKGRFWYIK